MSSQDQQQNIPFSSLISFGNCQVVSIEINSSNYQKQDLQQKRKLPKYFSTQDDIIQEQQMNKQTWQPSNSGQNQNRNAKQIKNEVPSVYSQSPSKTLTKYDEFMLLKKRNFKEEEKYDQLQRRHIEENKMKQESDDQPDNDDSFDYEIYNESIKQEILPVQQLKPIRQQQKLYFDKKGRIIKEKDILSYLIIPFKEVRNYIREQITKLIGDTIEEMLSQVNKSQLFDKVEILNNPDKHQEVIFSRIESMILLSQSKSDFEKRGLDYFYPIILEGNLKGVQVTGDNLDCNYRLTNMKITELKSYIQEPQRIEQIEMVYRLTQQQQAEVMLQPLQDTQQVLTDSKVPTRMQSQIRATYQLLLLETMRDTRGALANEFAVRGAKNGFWRLTDLYQYNSKYSFPMSMEGAQTATRYFPSKFYQDNEQRKKDKDLYQTIENQRFYFIKRFCKRIIDMKEKQPDKIDIKELKVAEAMIDFIYQIHNERYNRKFAFSNKNYDMILKNAIIDLFQ